MTRATDPLGRTTVYSYAPSGIDLLDVRQVNGQSTDLIESRTYNSQHQPLTVTDASGQTTTYTYNAAGQPLTVVTPPRAGISENRTTTYSYDTNGYLQSVTGPATGATTSFTYDGYGRPRTITDPDSYVITLDYDALDRPTRATYPDGTYDETVYNRLDAEKRRDRLGRWSETFYDALRRPVALRDALSRTTTLQWCNCGSLEKLIDANANTTTWERDIQGRITRTIRPDNSDALFTYEATTSRLKEFRDPRQQVIGLQYFADNNWKQVTYSNAQQPTPNVSLAYDPTYNRLVSITDGTGTTTYTYNSVTTTPSLGAMRLQTASVPVGSATATIAYGYDEIGRVVSRSIDGVTQSWAYDVLGRVGTEANALGSFSFTYDGVTDRLASLTYPSGQAAAFAYFGNLQDRRLQDIHNKRPGGATLSRFQYTYDAQGVIKTWTQQADSNPAKLYELGHDSVDELLTATLKTTDPTPVTLKRYRYAYDKAENRTGEQVDDAATAAVHNVINAVTSLQPGGALRFAGTVNEPATVTVQEKPASVAPDNRFEGAAAVASGTSTVAVVATDPSGNTRTNTFQITEGGTTKTLMYDANGNLTSDGVRSFEWDGVNRLTAVVQGVNRSEFTYDGWGHRIRIVEKDNGVVTSDRRFLWCGPSLAEERDGSGAVIRRFFSRGVQENGAAFFYASDHLGSIRELTDSAGVVRARYDYDPFGRMTKLSGDKESLFGFAGTVSHAASAMSLARFRAYDSGLGRWINPDPIGLLGGLNLYGYVQGRPVDLTDPLGLQTPGTQPPTEPPGGWFPWLAPAEQAVEKAVETAGVAAGTIGLGCLVILAALCQTGDGHPPADPQTDPVPPRTDPGPPQIPPVTPPTTQPPANAGSKQTNYIVDIVKGKCKTLPDQCDLLEEMLKNAKAANNTKLVQDITQAQKYLGCRNVRKRRGQ